MAGTHVAAGTENVQNNVLNDHGVTMVDMYPSVKPNVSNSSAMKRVDSAKATTTAINGSKLKSLTGPLRVPLQETNTNICEDTPTSADEDTRMFSSDNDSGDYRQHRYNNQQENHEKDEQQQPMADSASQPLRRWQLSDFDIGKPLGKECHTHTSTLNDICLCHNLLLLHSLYTK